MTIFDLLFLLLALAGIVSLIGALVAALRGRGPVARIRLTMPARASRRKRRSKIVIWL